MKIRLEIDEKMLKQLIFEHLRKELGNYAPSMSSIRIEVKSKQNYRSEWEPAEFRAVYEKQ